MHCGSIEGAKRLAAAYTLVLSAKAVGVNVCEYLTDVIAKLAGGWEVARIRELVPDAWAAARPRSCADYLLYENRSKIAFTETVQKSRVVAENSSNSVQFSSK